MPAGDSGYPAGIRAPQRSRGCGTRWRWWILGESLAPTDNARRGARLPLPRLRATSRLSLTRPLPAASVMARRGERDAEDGCPGTAEGTLLLAGRDVVRPDMAMPARDSGFPAGIGWSVGVRRQQLAQDR